MPIYPTDEKISHPISTEYLATLQAPNEEFTDYPADYDALTGIPNRYRFMEHLGQAINRNQRDSRGFSLLHIDLDRFKRINDTLGYGIGDLVLAAVARRIEGFLDEQESVVRSVARLGGDDFSMILERCESQEAMDSLAESLISACSRAFVIETRTLYAGISIGIASYPEDGQDIDSLLRHAEIAMYQAKSAGRGTFVKFNAEMEKNMLEDLSIEASLHNALANGEFEIYYQPMVSPRDGRTVALEALLRWHSVQHGEVSPERFIPMLEEIGLITAVGRWVLSTACTQFMAIKHDGLSQVILAVNLSGQQFRDAALVNDVQTILETTGLAPAQLELEITESILIDDASAAGKTLHALAALGVRLAIDDFGTGYSSLSYLRRFPINTLKIDRSFVSEMENSVDAEVVVKAIVNLARNLGLEVVAEGVENRGQLALLVKFGCIKVQGFLFSRPLPMNKLEIHRTYPQPDASSPVSLCDGNSPSSSWPSPRHSIQFAHKEDS